MTIIDDLRSSTPSSTAGILTGNGTDRFLLEIAYPTTGAHVLGSTFVLGTSTLADVQWYDHTEYVYGLTLTRGSSSNATTQPDTGVMEFHLVNPADNRYAPWASAYNGPGTFVRMSVRTGSTWVPKFFGVVESWRTRMLPDVSDTTLMRVRCFDLSYLLAAINDVAVPVTGAGDTAVQRLERITDFPVTSHLEATFSAMTLQSTDLSANRLSEVKQTASSIDAIVFMTGNGELRLVGRGYHPATWNVSDHIVKGSFEDSADDDNLIGRLYLARRNGEQRYYEGVGVSGQYVDRSYQFNDYLNDDDADLDVIGPRILGRSNEVYKPLTFTVNKESHADARTFIYGVELGDALNIATPYVAFDSYPVASMSHVIRPRITDAAVEWECTIGVGISHVSTWSEV